MPDETELIKERLRKLTELTEKGINPYPYRFTKTHEIKKLLNDFSKLDQLPGIEVAVAGRLMNLRRMGRATFGHVQDENGKMQIYLKEDLLGKEKYNLLKKIDIGDLLGLKGKLFRTKTGELTVEVNELEILCKSIRPLPEKFHGLKDPELRYRKRYLDLIMNPEVKEVFKKRTEIINSIRNTLNSKDFLEVETPILQPIYGGANAQPFKSHLNALDMAVYLRIANELYLKRLLIGGFERIYEFAKDFRNEGVDKTHNPEFTQIEAYQAYADYEDIMKLTQDMIINAAKTVLGTTKAKFRNHEINLEKPWAKITIKDALKKFADIDIAKYSDEELFDLRTTYNLDYKGELNRGVMIQLLFEALVEDKLIQPTFVTEHPIETTPLCKQSRQDPRFVERFELFIGGIEFANAYSEQNDPVVQRRLLEEQAKLLRGGEEEAHPMDEDFCDAMDYGMPPAGGVGVGIDRLVMLLTGKDSIREVVFFPFMKPQEKMQEDNNEA